MNSSNQQSAISNQQELEEKLVAVHSILQGCERVVVAFSGGVDSTLLLKLARDILGRDNVLAVTADSASLARADLQDAKELACALDVEHLVVPTDEVADAAYRANNPGRCYVCKRTLFHALEEVAAQRGISVVLYGAIGDDAMEERPGQRAARERGVRAPLQEAGLDKTQVRALARQAGLPNWDRPQNACLSSRIPHGSTVTEDKLRQVEDAEAFLRAQGFRQVRVRHLGTQARIEVDLDEVGWFQDHTLRRAVTNHFAQLGFVTVSLDRAGYRAGGADSMPAETLIGGEKHEPSRRDVR